VLNKEQLKEFALAMTHGYNVKDFPPQLNAEQMHEKRLAMEKKLDVTRFTSDVPAVKMRWVRELMEMNVEVNKVLNKMDQSDKMTMEDAMASADDVIEVEDKTRYNDGTIDVLNVYHLPHYRSFALLKSAENDYAVIDEFTMDAETKTITFEESRHYDNAMDAANDYLNFITEAENEWETMKHINFNMTEWELMEYDDNDTDDRVAILQNRCKDIRSAILVVLSKNPNECMEIRNAAKAALEDIAKKQDTKNVDENRRMVVQADLRSEECFQERDMNMEEVLNDSKEPEL